MSHEYIDNTQLSKKDELGFPTKSLAVCTSGLLISIFMVLLHNKIKKYNCFDFPLYQIGQNTIFQKAYFVMKKKFCFLF